MKVLMSYLTLTVGKVQTRPVLLDRFLLGGLKYFRHTLPAYRTRQKLSSFGRTPSVLSPLPG